MDMELVAFALKYLNFSDIYEKIKKKYHLDSRQCQILGFATQRYLNQNPVKVLEVIQLNEIASPATLHKIIQELVDAKLLKLQINQKDNRIKFLVPTPNAIKLLGEIGKQM
jgi:DNA-binding MarR family transcriptional regulator